MTMREMQDEIIRLKKEKGVCILAHSYQSHDVVEIADFVGDSFALSKKSKRRPRANHSHVWRAVYGRNCQVALP